MGGEDKVSAGVTFLFFGNRKVESDFLYRNEFGAYVRDKKLKLVTAFSRDQPHKIYVQHRLAEEKVAVWNALSKRDAVLYISGSSKGMQTFFIIVHLTACISCTL